MTDAIYYLSSLESARFKPVRECRVERLLSFDTGKVAFEAHLSPAIVGQDFDRTEDIDTVILTNRLEGVVMDPVSEFPCFVFITIPKGEGYALQSPIRSDDLQIIGWGELYRTQEDAKTHRFG